MKAIELSPGICMLIDETDEPIFEGRNWEVWEVTTKCGRTYRYLRSGKVWLHRLLLNAPPGSVVDHRDGDGLNNTRDNLRLCTHAENMRNRRINANHRVGFKGVQRRTSGLYAAQIRAGKTRRFKGGFATPEAAAEWYAVEAAKLHGDYAGAA